MQTIHRLGWALIGFGCLAQAFAAAPVFQRNDSLGVVLGDSVDYHLVAAGDVSQYAATGLPSGLVLNTATGEITGKPTDVGRYSVAVSATNADGTGTATLSIAVVDPSAGPLIYAPLDFDAYNLPQPGGNMFSCTLQATGAPSTFATSDTLPSGWSLAGSTIVGSTGQPGLYMVPVTATNANGIGSAAITIRVHPACTQLQQTQGKLQAGNVFTVTLQFNRPVTFSGTAPYLEFSTYPDGTTHRLVYVSGNGTSTFAFAYTVSSTDSGDITLFKTIQPAVNGAVSGLVDADGITLGASLPIYGSASPVATITAPAPAPNQTAAATAGAVATTTSTTGTTATATPSAPPAASAPVATTTGSTTAAAPASTNVATTSDSSVAIAPAAPAATGSTVSTTSTSTSPTVSTAASASDTSSGRLVNLSARGLVTDGDSSRSFIAGFVVSGSAPKQVLVRAIGPSLASFGVQNSLPNPQLRVTNASGAVVAQSDDWSGASTAATASAVGAFSLPAGSRDAAVAVTLAPGSYTMQVLPNGGSGVALAEVYDADTNPSGPLLNVSSRGFVGSGENVLTAGFVVGGSAPKRVLIRGVGPSLSAFGVTGTLANPVVKVYQGSTIVAQNDDWQTASAGGASAADISAAATAVGAFQLTNGSHDAATIVTLPPGVYSAVVSSADSSTGAALVEVYQF